MMTRRQLWIGDRGAQPLDGSNAAGAAIEMVVGEDDVGGRAGGDEAIELGRIAH